MWDPSPNCSPFPLHDSHQALSPDAKIKGLHSLAFGTHQVLNKQAEQH